MVGRSVNFISRAPCRCGILKFYCGLYFDGALSHPSRRNNFCVVQLKWQFYVDGWTVFMFSATFNFFLAVLILFRKAIENVNGRTTNANVCNDWLSLIDCIVAWWNFVGMDQHVYYELKMDMISYDSINLCVGRCIYSPCSQSNRWNLQ